MEKIANVAIDHVTVYTKDAQTLPNVMVPLGFYARDNLHYMFRNNYLECYNVKPTDPPYPFFTSGGGLHSFIFWADDVDASRERLEKEGYDFIYPNGEYTRYADHGEEKGEATFRGTYFASQVLPVGEVAVVQHKTLELIYTTHPDTNPNTAYTMKKLFLAVDEVDIEPLAIKFEKICDLIRGDSAQRCCMNELIISTAADLERETGVLVDPKRSCCVGIHFLVEDMDKMMEYAKSSRLAYKVLESGVLCVDASAPLNLFMLFSNQ
jgi:hypothetical protein